MRELHQCTAERLWSAVWHSYISESLPADEVEKVNLHLHTPCKVTRKVRLHLHQFLTSELDVGEWTSRRPRYLWSTSRPIAMVHYTPTTDCCPLLEYTKLSGDQTGNVHIRFNIEGISPNHCCCGKVISIIYSQCVSVALITQHAERIRPVVLSSAVYLAVQYFPTLSHKRHDFRENVNKHKRRASIFSTILSQKFFSF